MKRMNTKNIAVIGAGPSGLSAAFELERQGAKVTIYEKNAAAGGQCCSYEVDGKYYDMGAIIGFDHNSLYTELINNWPVRKQALLGERRGARYSKFGRMGKRGRAWHVRILFQLIKYTILYPWNFKQPGVKNDNKFSEVTSDFVKKRQSKEFTDNTDMIFTPYGYGYMSEVPALYYLKYCDPKTLWSMLKRKSMFTFTEGYQNFWKQVAADFNVIYEADIKKITRDTDAVFVASGKNVEKYDGLIVATPLQHLHTYLDCSTLEKELFSKIETYDYRTYLCRVKGSFDRPFYHHLNNFNKSRAGHVMMWAAQHGDTGVLLAYVQADGIRSQDIYQQLRDSLEMMGGELVDIIQERSWEYFPHVKTAGLESGFYKDLELLQGKNRMLMVGEIFNFSTVWKCVEWSRSLVRQHYSSWRV